MPGRSIAPAPVPVKAPVKSAKSAVPIPVKSSTDSGQNVDENAVLEDRLRGFFKHSIQEDSSEVYGGGYREAAWVVGVLGLDITLECVKDTQQLPRV